MAKKVIVRTIDGKKTPLVVEYKGVYQIPEKVLVEELEEMEGKGRKLGTYDDKGRIVYFSKFAPVWAKDKPSYKSQLVSIDGSKWYPEVVNKKTAIRNPRKLLLGIKRAFGVKALFGKGGEPKVIKLKGRTKKAKARPKKTKK